MSSVIKHRPQRDFLGDPSRFKFLLTGRRGGKTIGIVEDGLKSIAACPDNGEIFYIGPTNQIAKEIVWEAFEDRLDELGWDFKPRPSKSRFEFSRKRKLYVIGAEKIRRIRGHKVFKVYLDEVAFYSTSLKKVWRAVRPALSDLRGGAIVATTPDGKNSEAYDFYKGILQKKNWKYFYWTTADNPFISRDEIEEARQELDEKSFLQEYFATWESYEGLAYFAFNENRHLKPCREFVKDVPWFLTLDFNVNPTTLLVGQRIDGMVKFRREYSQKNSSTLQTMKTFCEEWKHLKETIFLEIHGDAAGHGRNSATGWSDYHYVQEVLREYGFQFKLFIPGVNPAIVDRVAHVNAWLTNAKGDSRVEIDPSCIDLSRDLSSQELAGRHPSDKNNLGHKADAMGYYISWHQILESRRPNKTHEL